MKTFLAVPDTVLSERIEKTAQRVTLIALAITKRWPMLFKNCFKETKGTPVTVVLDLGEDAS